MFKSTRKSKMVRVAAAAAAIGSIAAIGFAGNSPVNADPKQYSALVGYGSDTTQDVMNALAGFTNDVNFPPVQSQDPSKTQLASWDAFPANQCITTKVSSPTILRPNGSTNGRRILSRAFGGGTWGNAVCGQRDVSGLADFARSSSGPGSATGTDLVYIPFGRDAISWAYSKPSGSPVTDLTRAQLASLQVNGPQNIGGTVIIPCGIQTGSGTYATWNGMLGLATTGTPDTGTAFCNTGLVNAAIPDAGGRLQESNGPELKLKADVLATTSDPICDGVVGGTAVSCANAQVIIGFAASSWIARSNGVGSPAPGPGVAIGSIAGASPTNGAAPSLTPNSAFYASTIFGRDVYNVLPSETIDDIGNLPVRTMFVGPTSSVCQATATIQQFGFLSLAGACGSTTLTGPFVS